MHPFPTIIKEIDVKLNIPTHPSLLKQGGQHLELMIGFRRADLKVTVSSFTRVFLFFINLQLLNTARKKFRKFIIKEQLWNFIYAHWPNSNLKSEKYQDVDIPMLIEVKAL